MHRSVRLRLSAIGNTIQCGRTYGKYPTTIRQIVTVSEYGENKNIMRLGMSSPPVNSLDLQLIKDIKAGLVEAESNSACRGIVLSSECRAYCAGLNLNELYGSNPEKLNTFWNHFQDTLFSVYGSEKMLIAEINGPAPAGGCMLAMACDMRIATPNANVGLNEAAFGLVAPYFGAEMMEDLIGKRSAYTACSLGSMWTAEDALKIGMFDKVVDEDQLSAAVVEACEQWMKAPGRIATKKMMRAERLNRWREGQQNESDGFVGRVMDENVQTMIGRYLASLKKKK